MKQLDLFIDDEEKEKERAMQKLARHSMIVKLENDILADMMAAQLIGDDPFEYIRMLRNLLNSFDC